jgi:peroxiredoxin
MILGQTDLSQFKASNGDWSIVAILLTAFAGALSVIVFLYRKADANQTAEMLAMREELKQLRDASEECQKDRLSLHKEIGRMSREIELLKGSK